jgi:hypothetical protein
MLEVYHHKFMLALIIIVNLSLAVWNFWDGLDQARFLTASKVVLYDVRPVDRMHFEDDNEDSAHFEPWSKTASETGLTELQLAKFHLGCYAADNSQLSLPWVSTANMESYKAYSPIEKSNILSAMQLAAGGTKSRSVCNCIDKMLYSKLDKAKVKSIVDANIVLGYTYWQQMDPEISAVNEFVYSSGLNEEQRHVAFQKAYDAFSPLQGVPGYTADDASISEATFEAFRIAQGFNSLGRSKFNFTATIPINANGVRLMDRTQFIAFRDSLAGGDLNGDLFVDETEFDFFDEFVKKPLGTWGTALRSSTRIHRAFCFEKTNRLTKNVLYR